MYERLLGHDTFAPGKRIQVTIYQRRTSSRG